MADIESIRIVFTGDASGLEATINGISNSLAALEGEAARSVGATDKLGASAKKTTNALEKSGKKIKETAGAIDDITKPVQAVSVALAAGGVAAAKFAIDFEDNFAAVKKTVDGTPEQLEAIKKSIIDMTTVGINGHSAIPLTTAQLTELAAAGGQLGIATENITKYTETMAMLGTATNLQGEQGAATLARFMNVANVAEEDIDRLGSSIVDLGNNFATTEAEIADMALNMGATGEVVGMSPQDILAYSTALSSLGTEAAAGGSAVSRIWMDMQTAVSTGGKALNQFAKISGKSSAEFKKQWQSDASGAFREFLKGLNESDNIVGVLSDLGFNNIRDIQALQKLAGDKGFELLTEAITRSNNAWSENNALLTEFEAKAETTASKIQVTKNNLVEAARSIGETMMPTIAEWSGGVAEFAQMLAGMSDGTKEALVKTAAGIVAVGAASKGVVGTMKTIGSITEAIGKLKQLGSDDEAAQGAKGIKAIGTALSAIPLPAKLAVAGIAAVGVTAAVAYDKWYDSQYRWSEGLSEGNEKIKESLNEYKQISSIQGEIDNLKLVIENPDASKEQVENAKKRLEEIKQLLSEEYNLVIKADNSNLDAAVETVKKISKNDLQYNMNVQQGRLAELKDSFDSYNKDYAAANAKYEEALAKQTAASDLRIKVSELNTQLRSGKIELGDFSSELHKSAVEFGYSGEEASNFVQKLNTQGVTAVLNEINANFESSSEKVKTYKEEMGLLTAAHDEYIAISTELANWNTEMIQMAALEGDTEQVQKSLESVGTLIKNAGLDMEGYARAASAAMNGITIEDALSKGGESLDNVVNDYVRAMQTFGASAEQTAIGAALLKNGFKDIGQAAQDGSLDVINQQANDLAHSMGLIPEEKNIAINTQGDAVILEDVQAAVENINNTGNVTLEVSATGDVSALDAADEKLKELSANNQVTITVNADTGGFDINDLSGEKIGEITAEGTVNWEQGEVDKPEGEDAKATGTIDYELGEVATPENVVVTGTINYKLGEVEKPGNFAKGTQNFPGGLAMVNDQEGIADPRELIIDKGRAFIPQGKNVILPLSKGAKVYTASQTKAIMRGLGIPRYASGKNNKDDIDIGETIEELNKRSLAYIKDRTALNDWTKYGDDPLAAYDRIEERNRQMLDTSELTWDEYTENVSEAGEALYEGRIKQSEKWLEHELKYGKLSREDYIAGLDRMAEYTQEYYDKGLISEREYRESMAEIADNKRDSIYEKWQNDQQSWLDNRSLYEDWEAYGDSEISFYERTLEKLKGFFEEGIIGWEEFNKATSEAERNMFRAQETRVDKMLEEYQAQIDSVNEYYDNLINRKEEARTLDDLKADSADARERMAIYEGAVTQRGKEAYKQAKEDLKNAKHEMEIMRLQQEQNAVIKQMQEAYDEVEKNKINIAKGMSLGLANVNGIVDSINSAITSGSNGVVPLLEQLVRYVCNGNMFKMENYSDNRSVTNYFPSGIDVAAAAAAIGAEMR